MPPPFSHRSILSEPRHSIIHIDRYSTTNIENFSQQPKNNDNYPRIPHTQVQSEGKKQKDAAHRSLHRPNDRLDDEITETK